MAELRRNQRGEIGRQHVKAHSCSHFSPCFDHTHHAHPDQRRHKSDRPWHRSLRPLLLSNNVTGSFTSPSNWSTGMKATRSPPLNWERIFTASMISPVFHRPWLMVWPGFELTTSRSTDRRSCNWANRTALKMLFRTYLHGGGGYNLSF